jgi:hypothetical protein
MVILLGTLQYLFFAPSCSFQVLHSMCVCCSAVITRPDSVVLFTGALLSELSISPRSIMLSSKDLGEFTAIISAPLTGAAGEVKLFTCNAAGTPLRYVADMQQQSNAAPPSSSSVYAVSLALQGPQLGSLSSSPGVRLFTVVLGTDGNATGAMAQLELIAGGMPARY